MNTADCPGQAETLDKKFERPLRQHLETYRTIVTVRAVVVTTYLCSILVSPLKLVPGTLGIV